MFFNSEYFQQRKYDVNAFFLIARTSNFGANFHFESLGFFVFKGEHGWAVFVHEENSLLV